jgi:hypothetical protein
LHLVYGSPCLDEPKIGIRARAVFLASADGLINRVPTGRKRLVLSNLAGDALAAAPLQPPDAGPAKQQAFRDFPLAQPLLVMKVVELPEGSREPGDTDMQEVVKLEVVSGARR